MKISSANPIKWADLARLERQLPKWIPSSMGFYYRWGKAREWVDQQLKDRHDAGWEAQGEIHAAICKAAVEECDWSYPCFDLQDDMTVVFWSYYDGLDHVSAFYELEESLGTEMTMDEMHAEMDGTVESLIVTLSALRAKF